jgi:hypothetical protein
MGIQSPALHTTRAALIALAAGVALIVVRPAHAETSVPPVLAAPVATVAATAVASTTTVSETVQPASTVVAETTAPVATAVTQAAPQVPAVSAAPVVKPVVAHAPAVSHPTQTVEASTATIKNAEPAQTPAPAHLEIVRTSVPHVQRPTVHRVHAKHAKLPKRVVVVRRAPTRPSPRVSDTHTRAVAPVVRSAAIVPATHTTAMDATSSGGAASGAASPPVAASARTFSLPAAQPSVGAWPATEEEPHTLPPLAFERPG